jgi:hypothetical protein
MFALEPHKNLERTYSKGTEISLVLNNFFLSSETIPVQPMFRVNK